jgi:1-phosphofructokinase
MAGPTIVCLSANPAMDRRLRVESLTVGEVNRAKSGHGFAGGKAAHVAMSARALAANAVWIGFLGGAIGEECARQLESLGIQVAAIRTESSTRVNLEIIEDSGEITELLEPGVEPSVEERDKFLQACVRGMREEWKPAVLAISGSLPAGLKPDFYVSLIEAARTADAKVFVDTSGEAWRESSKARPDFVKLNRAEAGALVGRPLTTVQEIVHAAGEIVERGTRSAAITLGSDGLIWVESKNGPVWQARPPLMKVISTVGCGDATLAAFAQVAIQGGSLRRCELCGASTGQDRICDRASTHATD